MKSIWRFLIGVAVGTKVFKWDVKDLESVFCANSKKAFMDINRNKLGKVEASQMLRKTRPKWAMWPWEIADSFEGECIEETCGKTEVVEFCSRSDQNVANANLNSQLNDQRMERYRYCATHVEKRVNDTKQISYSNKRNTDSTEDKANIWRKELSPDRLFRGWWEELKKAYTRFCLQDTTDCARNCNIEHGTCNLWEDETEVDEAERWKYRCECDAGYGPSNLDSRNQDPSDSQFLCKEKIEQAESGMCETLTTLDNQNQLVKISPDVLNEEIDAVDAARRKRRMVGHYSGTAKNYFFPATVDIFHSTISLKRTEYNKESSGNSGIYDHRCGGTLAWDSNSNNKNPSTNKVLTAAHCFCHLDPKLHKLHDHFFIRVGLLDNKRALNMSNTEKPGEGTQYIDVRVKKIHLANQQYIEQTCSDGANSGKSDLAVMELERRIDFTEMSHVKPACNYAYQKSRREPKNDYMLIDNSNCYVSGWGRTKDDKGSLGISRNLKYARVTVVHPEVCKEKIVDSDRFVQTMEPDSNGNYPIICAEGYQDEKGSSNTCGGDSGGGLYCFDKKKKNYYLMGVLHGGNEGCTRDNMMYFNNNKHEDFKRLLQLS